MAPRSFPALSLLPAPIACVAALGLLLPACAQDIAITESAQCDGELNPQEDYVDSAFDRDADGYFDGANPQCQETYAAEDLDCNDGNEVVNPGAAEVLCNGIDDDCDEGTLDDDGSCNAVSYSGTWNFTPLVSQYCAMGLVNLSFSQITVLHADPSIAFTAGSGQPGTMAGPITDASFSATNTINGSCVETYTLTGEFTDATHMTATFASQFTGTCLGCAGQQWQITATKM